jgi:Large polyvalent protein associated domain 39
MIIDLPKLGPVNFDDKLSQDELKTQLEHLSKKYDFEIPRSELTYGEQASRAFTRGTKQLGSTFGDIIPAMAGKALGFDEYAQRQMGEAQATQEEINKYYAPQYKELSDVKGITDVPGFVLETIVEQIPNILTSLIPGVGLEAVAARTAANGIAKNLAVQAAEKGLAGEAANAFIVQGVKQSLPQLANIKSAAQNAGIFLGSYAQNAPEVFQNIYEETGKLEVGTSLLFGAGAAALDSVLPSQLAKSLTGPVKVGVVEKILEKSGMDKGLLRTVSANVLKGAGFEGMTEGAQEAISIAAEKFVADNPQVFGSKEWNRIMESSVRGAVGGAGFGTAGGVTESARRQSQFNAAQQKRAGRLDQYKQAAELKAEADAAGVSIEEYQQRQAQGELPGLETGPYSQLYDANAIKAQAKEDAKLAKEAAKNAPKDLSGKQVTLFDENGQPTKAAELAKTKGDKAEANRIRQAEQKEKTALKEAQAKLKKVLGAKQADLFEGTKLPTAKEAKAAYDAAEEERKANVGQFGLFGQPAPTSTAPAEEIAEPVVRAKPTPVTVEQLPTTIDADTFKTLGIGPTATFIKNKLIHGKDITDPAQAAEVKAVLEAAAEKHKNKETKAKIATFLSRPEFQQFIQETPNEPIARTGQPSLQDTTVPQDVFGTGPAQSITEPNAGGVAAAGLPVGQNIAGEGAVERPLGTKEKKDVAKTEKAVSTHMEELQKDIDDNTARTALLLSRRLDALAEKEGVPSEEVNFEPSEVNDIISTLQLPGLFGMAFDLQDSINNPLDTPEGRVQQKRDMDKLGMVKAAIAKLGGEATKFLNNLINANEENRADGISFLNRHGNEAFDNLMIPKIAEAKDRIAKQKYNKSQQEELKAETNAQIVAMGKARESSADRKKERKQEAELEENVDYVHYGLEGLPKTIEEAAADDKFQDFITGLADTETDPTIKGILKKIENMRLKTKTKVGKVVRKKGELGGESDAGAYDPATDTITLDPTIGLTRHNGIHESVHAAISHVLRNPDHPLTKKLTAIYDSVYSQIASSYGAQDIQEFAAELVGNPQFRAALKGMSAPRSGNMLQRIVQALAEFFGFRKGTNAYDAGIKAINEILDIADTVAPSSGEQMFNIISEARDAMPVLGKQAVEQTLNTFSNLKGAGYKALGLSLMRLDHINKIWGDKLPAIQTLIDALEKRRGYQEAAIKRVKDNYSNFLKIAKSDPAGVRRMEDMAYEARMAGVDPANPNFVTTATNVAKYQQLRVIYNALPKDVREMYDTLRNDYKKAFDTYKNFLLNSTDDPTLKQKIKAQFETNSNVVAYIPFLRRGDYWVRYPDPTTGEEAASAFESIRERQQFIDKNLKGIQHTTYQNLESMDYSPQSIPSSSFIAQVIKGLSVKDPVTGKMTPASQQQMNNVYQAYLALFPAGSIAKNFMRSKNVPGMEKDIIRGYGDTMLKWTRKLADTMYVPQIDAAVQEIQVQADNSKDDSLAAVYKHIKGQEDFFHNPTFSKFTHAATTLSYFEYISGNISSALINLTALPMLVYPILGGRFGFSKAFTAMTASNKTASNWVLKGDNTDPKYKGLYDYLQEHGQLEHTQARELMEGRRITTEKHVGLKAKILDGLSIPFSATEKYNRAVTAIAAYDLAKANDFSEEKALRLAMDTVKDVHTSGMAETAPKWRQHPIGRVFFTFKSFAWNSAFLMARAFQQAFFEQTQIMKKAKATGDMKAYEEAKAIRDAARRQLLGTLFMTSTFAGVKGLPFMGLAQVTAQMLHALFGDDDEPYDFHEDLRAFFGELIYKGPVNYITNLEISNRVGVAQDLIWRDDPRASDGLVLGAMQKAFGPAGSYLVNVENAAKMFNEGHTERAIEAVMPSFIRNGLKGTRYMVEGARTLKGDPVEEDINAYNAMMQVIGFSPASLSSKYEITSAAKGYEKKVADKRQRLLNMYDMARTGGDSDLMAETREDINDFNAAHPGNKITGTTLQKSISARKAAEKNMINGVTFNKKLLPEIRDKFFDEED